MLAAQFSSNAGAMVTLALGLLALIYPNAAARFVSIEPIGMTGVSEVRATYGGFFAALGGFCLYSQSSTVFLVAGVAWFGAAIGRTLSVFMDRSYATKNLAGILFEAGIGTLLLVGGL